MSAEVLREIASQTDPRWALQMARSAVSPASDAVPLFVSVVAPAQLAGAIATLRSRHGWSVRAAATVAGVSPATIMRAERGANVDAATLVALTEFIRTWWWREAQS